MKKMNKKFHLLTPKAMKQVKGGGWEGEYDFDDGFDPTDYDSRRERRQARRAWREQLMNSGGCPPPDPSDD